VNNEIITLLLGWNDIGYISSDLPGATPHMNRYSKLGVKLTHYYAQPSCTPSRVAMMTGKFPYKNGFQDYELQADDVIGVPLSNKLMPAYMKELGYRTVMFGKWNIGHCNKKYLPHERGFDSFLGYNCPGHGYKDYTCRTGSDMKDMLRGSATYNESNQRMIYEWNTGYENLGTYDTKLYRDLARAAIVNHSVTFTKDGKPLFMWIAHHGIHSELDSDPDPPDEMLSTENWIYLDELSAQIDAEDSLEQRQLLQLRKTTAAVLQSLDNALNDLVMALDETGMLMNTVIFVNSDNGGNTVYTRGHPGNNYPLRSLKFGYFEGGVRVPAFIYAPGILTESKQGKSYDGLMHHVDLLATFYGIGGGDVAVLKSTEANLDSTDHWSAIKGELMSPRNEIIFNLPRSTVSLKPNSTDNEGLSIRIGKYKLLLNHPYDYWFSLFPGLDYHNASMMMAAECKSDTLSSTYQSENPDCTSQNFLFDLDADPTERVNLYGHMDYLEDQALLTARAKELLRSMEIDYGEIVSVAYDKGLNSSHLREPSGVWEDHDNFVVPWDCEVIL